MRQLFVILYQMAHLCIINSTEGANFMLKTADNKIAGWWA